MTFNEKFPPEVYYEEKVLSPDTAERRNDNPMTLVLCLDGTQNEFGYFPFSNALKFFKLLDKDGSNQLCYYQPGVGVKFGTSLNYSNPRNFFSRFTTKLTREVDSVFAFSFDVHVKAAYIFLMRFYREGDKICLIGFSRGSFAARILVGMLESVGLLNRGLEDIVSSAWDIYANWENAGQPSQGDYSASLVTEFKRTFCRSQIKIHFMGLFDSVNSVGLIRDRMFPYTSRTSIVGHIRHAVSLDERRGKFKQVLLQPYSYYPHITDLDYEECGSDDDNLSFVTRSVHYLSGLGDLFNKIFGRSLKRRPDDDCHCQDIKELAFPGNHGDVGGGWQDNGTNQCLSNISFRWMLAQAIEYGIKFKQGTIHQFDASFPVTSSFLAYNHDMLDFSNECNHSMIDKPQFELPNQPITGNNRSGTSSFLETIFWWTIELLPVGIKIEDEKGEWKRIYIPNFGRPRKLPPNMHLHWSLFYRLHYFSDYLPKNIPSEELGKKFYDSLRSFKNKFDLNDLDKYKQGITIEEIKRDWNNDIWRIIPDELEEMLHKNNAL